MFWAFGTAPEGTFGNLIFPGTQATVTSKNLDIDNVFSSLFFKRYPTIPEYWGVLPL
jgi:hypothetical protein